MMLGDDYENDDEDDNDGCSGAAVELAVFFNASQKYNRNIVVPQQHVVGHVHNILWRAKYFQVFFFLKPFFATTIIVKF